MTGISHQKVFNTKRKTSYESLSLKKRLLKEPWTMIDVFEWIRSGKGSIQPRENN